MRHNIPNLDALDEKELMQFWAKHRGGQKIKDLFPEGGTKTKLYTRELATYAENKATAINLRLKGAVNTALATEKICQQIYDKLPPFARW